MGPFRDGEWGIRHSHTSTSLLDSPAPHLLGHYVLNFIAFTVNTVSVSGLKFEHYWSYS